MQPYEKRYYDWADVQKARRPVAPWYVKNKVSNTNTYSRDEMNFNVKGNEIMMTCFMISKIRNKFDNEYKINYSKGH